MPAIDWTPHLESAVLEAIENGDNLRKAAASQGISASAIIRHARDDEKFAKQYARALDIRTDVDCDEIADKLTQTPESNNFGSIDSGWVQWQRVQIDAMKWLLSKRNPKKYGEKVQQEVSGPDGAPLPAIMVQFVKTPDANQS